MNKREFAKLLKVITTKKTLDIKKIPLLTNEQRSSMVYFIIRNRCPLVTELIPPEFDLSWLACMGYMYHTHGKSGYNFTHNSEQIIK
jgi:hypothetical protein